MRHVLAALLGVLLSCDGVSFCGQKGGDEDDGGGGGSASCCVRCTDSKPCGNSCISWDKTCHVASGCACAEIDDGQEQGTDLVVEEDSST